MAAVFPARVGSAKEAKKWHDMDRVQRSAWPVPCDVANAEPCDLAKAERADECEAESKQSPLACRKRAKRELRFRARDLAKPLQDFVNRVPLVSGLPIFGSGKSIL
jgi:hypothetical protein